MRSLLPPPRAVVDPVTKLPCFGSYRGDLPRVDLRPLGEGPIFSFLHEKRWLFGTIIQGELLVGFAIVHLRYAVQLFFFAFDRQAGRMLLDRSLLALPFQGQVGDAPAEGCAATFLDPLRHTSARIVRPASASAYSVDISAPVFELHARLEAASAPPAIGAIVPLAGPPPGLVQVTQKHALLTATGEALIARERRSLDGALAGMDYSHGFVSRRTAWQWVFALGRSTRGERVGLNLVEGFVGAPECAIWIDDQIFPLAEGRFLFDAARPLDPWQIRTADGSADLRFIPDALHAEERDLGLIASHYIQPVGSLSGSVRVEGRPPIELDRVLGVVEDQAVRW